MTKATSKPPEKQKMFSLQVLHLFPQLLASTGAYCVVDDHNPYLTETTSAARPKPQTQSGVQRSRIESERTKTYFATTSAKASTEFSNICKP
jgi:hypothetical protein